MIYYKRNRRDPRNSPGNSDDCVNPDSNILVPIDLSQFATRNKAAL